MTAVDSCGIERTADDMGAALLDDLAAWMDRYIKTAQPGDLHTLVLWAVHTHLALALYTSPRLLLDSPVPGSGKTTVLDHLNRLCHKPMQAASLSSPSLLVRFLEHGPRTVLVDEADRTLNPKAEGVSELLAVLNSGYRRGASRPVLIPDREGGWATREMPTFGPVAMAGNAPDLPDDTRSRCIRVLLLPDTEGTVEDSDWELIEQGALDLHARIETWADYVREDVRTTRPEYPEGLKGRNRERWAPLLRVAYAAGGHWPGRCLELIDADLERQEMDREAGLQRTARHIVLLDHIRQVWTEGRPFMPTMELLALLKSTHPDYWKHHDYGELTRQGLARMLANHFNIRAVRETGGDRHRGYFYVDLEPAWNAFGMGGPTREA
ncbi:DUF3631 domain-containing protein [Corynebacterium sp. YIM 101645]|uniref:DUF3631 domain-containing protein n=1 Tax=Corynebacterium lemuris TaxID=1859292 RepID=A0ABT2FU21_9CORY|nr:DUF3631 domain-containing protein [Corynebacterium lemuris]MCS5478725.1 DUF3631 domain-containing protein [Corynebacterium lemuris]